MERVIYFLLLFTLEWSMFRVPEFNGNKTVMNCVIVIMAWSPQRGSSPSDKPRWWRRWDNPKKNSNPSQLSPWRRNRSRKRNLYRTGHHDMSRDDRDQGRNRFHMRIRLLSSGMRSKFVPVGFCGDRKRWNTRRRRGLAWGVCEDRGIRRSIRWWCPVL